MLSEPRKHMLAPSVQGKRRFQRTASKSPSGLNSSLSIALDIKEWLASSETDRISSTLNVADADADTGATKGSSSSTTIKLKWNYSSSSINSPSIS
ncbi:hypothetical protein QYF36_006016 [Acer negundo]|nr:hypothetical protein QYF36_006016 [Acer negundo]